MATSVTYDVYARDRASKTFKSVGNSASGLGSLSAKAALGVAAVGTALAATAVAAARFTYKVGSTYVASLNKIQALTGANDATMQKAAKTLESNAGLYAKMGQTTGDAAAGVVELTKAGLSLHDSLKAVNATMVLAKAGELSVADASTLVANSLNTFGLKAKDAAKIANQLANAANISSADVSDLAESFKYVAPIAAQSGVSMAQVNAILAELSNSGIKASNAGTGLRKFLLSLQAPGHAATKDLSALNVEIFDASGKMKPLTDVVGQLSKAMNGLSDKQRSRDLKDIFGLQGAAAAQIILKGNVKGLDDYTKGVNKAGAAARLAEANSKGLAGTLATMKAQVTSEAQALYREYSPALNQALLKGVALAAIIENKLAPALKRAGQEFKKDAPAVNQFVAAVKSAGPPLGKMTSGILSLGQKSDGKSTPALVRLARVGVGQVIAYMARWVDTMGSVADGINAWGAQLAWGARKVAQFGDAAAAGAAKTGKAFAALPGKIKGAVGNLGSVLYGAGQQAIQGLIDGIQSKISSLTSKLHSITSMIPLHKGPIEKDRVLLKPAGVAIMEGLIDGIESKRVAVQKVLDRVTASVQAAGSKLRTALQNRNSFASGFQSFSSSAFGADYGTDDAGNAIAPTAASVLAYQKQQAAQAHLVKRDVRKLVKMGLSPALIKQLQAAGAAGIPTIEALANGSQAQIRQYNALNKQTSADLQSAGMTAGNRLYGQQIKADREHYRDEQKVLREIRDLLKETNGKATTFTIHGRDLIAILKKEHRVTGTTP